MHSYHWCSTTDTALQIPNIPHTNTRRYNPKKATHSFHSTLADTIYGDIKSPLTQHRRAPNPRSESLISTPPTPLTSLPLLSLTHNGPSCQSDQALLTPCLLTLISLWLRVNSWLEHQWGGTLQTTFDPRQPLRLGSGPIGGSAAALVAMETGPAEAQMARQGVEWVERERETADNGGWSE